MHSCHIPKLLKSSKSSIKNIRRGNEEKNQMISILCDFNSMDKKKGIGNQA